MRTMAIVVAAAGLVLPGPVRPQSNGKSTSYKTERQHPRLLVPAQRARLLKRETERESLRWIQFHTLVAGKVEMPEPGFAMALYYLASGSNEHGRQAIQWALGRGNDLRQLALVFDWCQPLVSEAESRRLALKMTALLEKTAAAADVPAVRSRVLAALALADHVDGVAEKYIQPVVEVWWKERVLGPVQKGEAPLEVSDHWALFEMFHALRDNLDIDLREGAAKFFAILPIYHLLAHYPAPFPAPESEYRLPLMKQHGEPDLREAVWSRAAALSMVAYDNNAQEMQFLQGWLIQDRYLMRGSFGIPYEFLWANPYQPGLSFHYLPNVFHDPATGRLIVRSSWEDEAVWYYQAGGVRQMFRDGQIENIGSVKEPIVMGNTVLLEGVLAGRFEVNTEEATHYYIVGLKPSTRYDLEVDDEELREVATDRGGVLELNFPGGRKAVVLMRVSPEALPQV